ncbi:sugar phosphate isomerase/epimerase family protein [Halobacterium litoreum]|uniref:Sugar phosphate isomerase/epimerase family protein n=1 Tax=Halobacterium litoreum TaxID=2039234 RepID=A0ABD5NDV9_9EURY|nr:sugar phosphate isomerase/epimerase [Halobacterium litoreum]UHH13840.1 sugar phosphate isomerase/epimerase [Halobacterium litoreum]
MQSYRRDVLKATGGSFALGLGATPVAGGQSTDRAVQEQEQETGDDVLASYWAHAGDVKPFTSREWSPWDFERRVEMLAEVGFDGIGIYHADLQHMVEEEGRTLEAIGQTLSEAGIDIVELEFLVNWMLPESDYRRQAEQETRQLLLDAADVLGARHIKVGNINGYPVETSQLQSAFAQLCSEAADVNTMVGMEILPPDPNAETMDQVLEWVRGPENGGLFLDTWHINNIEGISYEDVANLDASDVTAVEMDDGFSGIEGPGFIEQTVNLRRVPGYGDFDVQGFVDAVRATGFDGPWGNEILSEEFRRLPMEPAYRRVYAGAQSVLGTDAGDGMGDGNGGDGEGTGDGNGDGTTTPGNGTTTTTPGNETTTTTQ